MIIKEAKNYLLELDVKPCRHLTSVELYQTFPEAQRPRRQRLVQLNLTTEEVNNLVLGLLGVSK